jgi:predicted metal-dependent phosphotriesterase family hydrolase
VDARGALERKEIGVPTVETVQGPVELDALGPTLMHEHIFVMQPEPLQNFGKVLGGG